MKLKYEIEFMELGDEIVAVPISENLDEQRSIIKVNETAKMILQLLSEDNTIENILKQLSEKYSGTSYSEIKEYVEEYIETLKCYGLLID